MAEQFTIPFAQAPDFTHAALIAHQGISTAQDWLAAPDWPTPALVLHGPPATGKSHLAALYGGQTLDLSQASLGPQDAEDLFHLLNRLKAEGGRLLILSRQTPGQIYPALPDLDSRLRASSQVALSDPKEDEVRQAIFFKLCTDQQLRVDMETAAYICTRLPQTNQALDLFCQRAGQEFQRSALTKPAARPLIERCQQLLDG